MLFVSAFILMITPSFAQGGMKKAHDKERGKAKMEEMFNQLELSADQIEVVKKILKEERISLKETRIPKEEMEAMNLNVEARERFMSTLRQVTFCLDDARRIILSSQAAIAGEGKPLNEFIESL